MLRSLPFVLLALLAWASPLAAAAEYTPKAEPVADNIWAIVGPWASAARTTTASTPTTASSSLSRA